MKRTIKACVVALMMTMLCAVPTFAVTSDLTSSVDPATCNHRWSDWYTTEYESCGDDGKEERSCWNCDATEERTIPATGDHEYDSWYSVRKATVFKAGKKARDCWYCDHTQTASVAKVKPFAKFTKSKRSLKRGKSIGLKKSVRMGRGDSVRKWKSSNSKVATVSKKGTVKAKKSGKAVITVVLKSGKKAKCTVKVTKPAKKKSSSSGSGTVYWTPSGGVWHASRHCTTLSRSRTVYSGSRSQSGKPRGCYVCS